MKTLIAALITFLMCSAPAIEEILGAPQPIGSSVADETLEPEPKLPTQEIWGSPEPIG